jgi:hypothetical protein
MDRTSSRSRSPAPEWQRSAFWREVEAEIRRVEALELARFAGASSLRAPGRRSFERELWERLKAQLPT